jgi:hypothetical protein
MVGVYRVAGVLYLKTIRKDEFYESHIDFHGPVDVPLNQGLV